MTYRIEAPIDMDLTEAGLEDVVREMQLEPPCLIVVQFSKQALNQLPIIDRANDRLNKLGIYFHPEVADLKSDEWQAISGDLMFHSNGA